MSDTRKQRLDILLVERGLVKSRSRARDLILRGNVIANGVVAERPGQTYQPDAVLSVDDEAARYVSRGALKLIAALDAFGFNPEGGATLDIGASTGGFAQVLLERGASHVTCVDVGKGQLSEELKSDARVTCLEGLDARKLSKAHITGTVTGITADVSFISLAKVLPSALDFAAPGCWLVALIKPQFEVGPDHVARGGIVRDADQRDAAVNSIRNWLNDQPGWVVNGVIDSPITGGDGNREYLLGAEFRL